MDRLREFLPCPFCGTQLEWCTDSCGYVHDIDIECFMASIGVDKDQQAAWNTRATDPLMEEMARVLEFIAREAESYQDRTGKKVSWLNMAEEVLQKYREATCRQEKK